MPRVVAMDQEIELKDFVLLKKAGLRIKSFVKAEEAAGLILKNVSAYFPEDITVNYFNVKCTQKWTFEYVKQIASCLEKVEWLYVKPSISNREVPNLWVDYNDRLSHEQKSIIRTSILEASNCRYLFLNELSQSCGQRIYKADVTRILDAMNTEFEKGKYSYTDKKGGCFRINGYRTVEE